METKEQLSSNGIPIPFEAARFVPMSDRSELLHNAHALHDEYARVGHVLLRGAIPFDVVDGLRARFFELMHEGSGAMLGHGLKGHPAHTLVREPIFEGFTQHPTFRVLAAVLLDGPVVLLKRSIIRHFVSGSRLASRAHADRDYFTPPRHHFVTFWVPLVDVPLAAGGLVVLEDSVNVDIENLRRTLDRTRDRLSDSRPISPHLEDVARASERRWLFSHYRAGDVVAFSPQVVHASLDCQEGSRLSADIRFAKATAQIDPRWMQPWSGDDGA